MKFEKQQESDIAIINRIINAANATPQDIALFVDGKTYTFAQLLSDASGLSRQLRDIQSDLCVLYIDNSYRRYVGLVACLLADKTYMPMSISRATMERTRMMFSQVENMNAIYVVATEEQRQKEILPIIPAGRTVLQTDDIDASIGQPLQSEFVQVPTNNPNSVLMFTSGSTGMPKMVMLTKHNVEAFVDNATEHYQPQVGDRFSHMASYAFDCHILDIFVPWSTGAGVFILSQGNRLVLELKALGITHAMLGPSAIRALKDDGFYTKGYLTNMKVASFGGEPSFADLLDYWSEIAPNCRIFNIYGPTEATVMVTLFEYPPFELKDSVPLGKSFANIETAVVDEQHNVVPFGGVGELLIRGSQVCNGYLNEPTKSAKAFIDYSKDGKLWYATGDYVSQSDVDGHGFNFHGRKDDRMKIKGNRIEKIDLELQFRSAIGVQNLAVLPIGGSNFCTEIALYVAPKEGLTEADVRKACERELKYFMQPKIVQIVPLPLNQNGKVDYRKLAAHLAQNHEQSNIRDTCNGQQ